MVDNHVYFVMCSRKWIMKNMQVENYKNIDNIDLISVSCLMNIFIFYVFPKTRRLNEWMKTDHYINVEYFFLIHIDRFNLFW